MPVADAGLHIAGVAGATLGKHIEHASFDTKGGTAFLGTSFTSTVAPVKNSRRKKKVGVNGPCLYVPYLSTRGTAKVMEGIVGTRKKSNNFSFTRQGFGPARLRFPTSQWLTAVTGHFNLNTTSPACRPTWKPLPLAIST